eukprot:SAG22_NODE_8057_length_687_cov_0.731293_2_plen_65_part_00
MDVCGGARLAGGFLVAILVLSPEAMTAINAARANQLQRTVNIALGASALWPVQICNLGPQFRFP